MHSKRIITGSNSNFIVEKFIGPYDIPMVRIAAPGQKIDQTEKQFDEMVRLTIARDLEASEIAVIADVDLFLEMSISQRWNNTAKDFGDGF